MIQILLSDLAVEQLSEMPPKAGRKMLDAMRQLRTFPHSAPPVVLENYESYRQLIARPYRAIYRYLEETQEIRVYCILHVRRALPAPEFLTHQIF
ncbi:MAG: type II toxin-antitoxin system RelE/ParE family toxin [Chloroflexi bacterium]|nr:type II toxin-antitoxin system RelE/ParE family toxin [Ardenticatenaceae bacterium]MBL1131478.1 type II toxin-antitoxin system RelE/ParE family toxin [Chloroflexota bacterium]NOG37589.1 type II toxin-antitoxin system RelE/ParE family toxin [Chloroflexota bacterium]GIK57398.1 MAG: hypothetical protein BroJett015_30610 [Chloroflexota bacterium]